MRTLVYSRGESDNFHPLGCPSSDAASEYLITLRRNPIVTTQPATILSEVGAT